MKRFAGLLLAMVMVMSMAVSVFADGEDVTQKTTYSITINNPVAGHTYAAYQIFAGDIAKEAENDAVEGTTAVLSNITWGTGITDAGKTALLTFGENTYSDEEALAKALNNSNAKAFAEEVAQYLAAAPNATSSYSADSKNYTISNLDPGYYLVKDMNAVTGNDALTTYILEVVENSTLSPKSDVPEVVKKVDDKNDSDSSEDETVWQDSADYDIGDAVPFKLEATLADNVSEYDYYKIVFQDTLSDGLTYKNDAKVYMRESEVTEEFSITYDKETRTLTISCNDVKEFGATNKSVITVLYTAELNEAAKIGAEGNPNKVKLQFSNDPNWKPEGEETPENPPTGETPEDVVVVFTYETIIDKIDNTGEALAGAEFTLEKKVGNTWVPVEKVLTSTGTTFSFKGLDDGEYRLTETKTPAGYNTIDPICFTVVAEHTVLQENEEGKTILLKTLTVTSDDAEFAADVAAGKVTRINGTQKELESGQIYTEVVNQAGTTLPETGGMGTTLFYVIGATLAIGAAVVMVTRKRMSAN